MNEKRFTYDVYLGGGSPVKGQYIVSIGKRGIGQVMLVNSVRLVKARTPRDFYRFAIVATVMPALKEFTEYEWKGNDSLVGVWVRGEIAWPCFWHPRGKKKPPII